MKVGILLLLITSILLVPGIVFAQRPTVQDARGFATDVAGSAGLNTGKTVQRYSGDVISGALGIVGFLFFIFMIYGGFIWFTSRGNEDRVTKGKGIVIAAVIGLVVIVAAYAITWFVTQRLIVGTGTPTPQIY